MEDCISWTSIPGLKEQPKRKQLVQCLHEARKKLAPIVDNVILSTFHLMKKGDKEWFRKYTLTPKECQDIVWASHVLHESEFTKTDQKYDLPNMNVVVNNVSLENSKVAVTDKPVVIDEATILELLDLYKSMGVVIQKIIAETARVEPGKKPTSLEKLISASKISERSIPKSGNSSSRQGTTLGSVLELDETDQNPSIKSSKIERSSPARNQETDDEEEYLSTQSVQTDEDDVNPPRKKSTLSALIDGMGSTGDSNNEKTDEEATPATMTTDDERKPDDDEKEDKDDEKDDNAKSDDDQINDCCCSPSIFIKIKCNTDTSDGERDDKPAEEMVIHCAKSCTSHQHVKLNGDPITLKMNQDNVADGTVYCIDTGGNSSENEIRIIIKQCPDCKSTIISSTTKIVDMFGESHESITLHGKQGDESKMIFSSDEESIRKSLDERDKCACLQKGRVCTDLSKERCEELNTPCTCDELEQLISNHSEPRMDVWIDTDSVDKSTIKTQEEPEESVGKSTPEEETEEERPRTPSTISEKFSVREESRKSSLKFDPGIPLTRRRVCSSMEFDVSEVHTRLRSQEIEHKNAHIVVELQKLGVDNLLRACRPARCCRKAILNERQRTALPYCVSLRSLPLISTDIQVIEQSIDMSVKKIKNATDLTQIQRDKLAYYVSLGRDDFKPGGNYPWVIPVYDMKFGNNRINKNKFFLLKDTVGIPKQVGSVKKLMNLVTPEQKEDPRMKNHSGSLPRRKFFILKKPISNNLDNPEKCNFLQRLWTRGRGQSGSVRFKLVNKLNNDGEENGVLKMLNYCEKKRIYSKKNEWRDDHWRLIFTQEHKQFTFGETDKSEMQKEPISNASRPCKESSHLKQLWCREATNPTCRQREASKKCKPLEGGDYSFSSLSTMIDTCFKKLRARKTKIFKKKSKIDLRKGKSLLRFKSMPSVTKNAPNEIFYSSKAVTILVKRTHSLENKNNTMHISKLTKIEGQWDNISPPKPKKQLEYYVSLINGDLVWSNKFPLKLQKFDTYYNHSNKTSPPSTLQTQDRANPNGATDDEIQPVTTDDSQRNTNSEDPLANASNLPPTVEDQDSIISNSFQPAEAEQRSFKSNATAHSEPQNDATSNITSVSKNTHASNVTSTSEKSRRSNVTSSSEKSRRSNATSPSKNSQKSNVGSKMPSDGASVRSNAYSERQRRRSTISEIKPEHIAELHSAKPRSIMSPPSASPRSTISEITSQHFADFQANPDQPQEKSLPARELPPGFPPDLIGPENADEEWAPLVASDTSLPQIQEVVIEKEVKEPVEAGPPEPEKKPKIEKKGPCSRRTCGRGDPKKRCPGDITIAIKKAGGKKVVDSKTLKPCHKEVCELYKNKNLADKPAKPTQSKSGGRDQTVTITSNDNIEIYINNQKICLGNNKCKKTVDGETKK